MATDGFAHLSRVDVVFLAYNPAAVRGKDPTVTLDSVCTVSLYQLERHLRMKRAERVNMSEEAYKHYRWYNAALVTELRTTGNGQPRPLLRAFHWYIETSNVDAFRIDGQQCEAVSLIVAAEVEHWYCARPWGQSSSGRRARVTPCSGILDQKSVKRPEQKMNAGRTITFCQLQPHRTTPSRPMSLERICEEL